MVSRNLVIQLLIGLLMIVLLYGYISSRTGLEEGEFLVEDPSGTRMIIEVDPDLNAIELLLDMHSSGDVRWVGGLVEKYENEFDFRFEPETIIVANFTAEGLQAVYFETIQDDFNYWQGLGHVYIKGKVVRVPS